ncbi:hypothetical protein NM688_g8138 [Phlebia brevispora]|uniref:Uncharacterized protein n=1 Tax=Phlebia brevispora TaxID=194682 RepID=A0ACC1RWS4_9APHY|nr:hypothetical protein NM688_g8138 [Phlebia brevispora]
MQSILRGWNRWRPHIFAPIRKGLQVKPDVLKTSKPAYDRKPPWWARFTYTFIITDLAVTAAMAELVFDTWTEEKVLPEGETVNTKTTTAASTSGEAKDTEGPPKTFVARPLWQRLPLAGAQIAVGVGIAIMILTSHARIVRQLYVVPSSSLVQNEAYAALAHSPQSRFVLIKSANGAASSGHVFPLDACKLERGHDDAEMNVHVQGIRGNFWVGLPGATVNGEKTQSTWHAREALYNAFYGKDGKKMMAREAWNIKDGQPSIRAK